MFGIGELSKIRYFGVENRRTMFVNKIKIHIAEMVKVQVRKTNRGLRFKTNNNRNLQK